MASERTKTPVLFGEVLFDCFEDGGRVLGGAPFNVAWHLRAFGAHPLLISRVGDDAMGREIRATMRHWGMSTAGLQMDSTHPTGAVRIRLRDGQPSFDILPNRAYDHIQADALPPRAPSLVYHGSLGLRQADSAATLDALLARHPVPVFLDVNLRTPWWQPAQLELLLGRARWVKINDHELESLVEAGDSLKFKARSLLQCHGLSWVIVTRGAAGAFIVDAGGDCHEVNPGGAMLVVDTVGAGDAFASVCILGLLRRWPLELTLRRAQQFASLLVGQRGAILRDAAVYESLSAAWEQPR